MINIRQGIISGYALKARWRKTVWKIIATTGALIMLIAVLSFYGQSVGSFVITMDKQDYQRGLALSVTEDFSEPVLRLTADPLKKATDCEIGWIPSDEEISKDLGVKNGYKKNELGQTTDNEIYFAYTFLLKNVGKQKSDYVMRINLEQVTKSLDSILRIKVIDQYPNGEVTSKVYAKAREDKGYEGEPEEIYTEDKDPDNFDGYKSIGQTTPFVSDNIIAYETIKDLRVNQVHRYTVIMWLDGWDFQSDNSLLEGALKCSMDFYLATDVIIDDENSN